MKRALMPAWLLALIFPLQAADQASAPVTDPAVVQQHFQAMLARPEFHEQEEAFGNLRWTDWASQWLTHLVSRLQNFRYAGQMSALAWLFVIALTVLALTGLIYVLVRLSRRQRDEAPEEIEPASPGSRLLSPRQYEQRLRGALERRDWHGAWLAAWLQLLARLENRHLVDPDRSRTNREYLAQLRARTFAPSALVPATLPPAALPLIARLVDDYDRFIYGLRVIDEPGWGAFRERIDEVTLMLNLRDHAAEEPA
jgi:hypothetical protein